MNNRSWYLFLYSLILSSVFGISLRASTHEHLCYYFGAQDIPLPVVTSIPLKELDSQRSFLSLNPHFQGEIKTELLRRLDSPEMGNLNYGVLLEVMRDVFKQKNNLDLSLEQLHSMLFEMNDEMWSKDAYRSSDRLRKFLFLYLLKQGDLGMEQALAIFKSYLQRVPLHERKSYLKSI